MKKGFKEEMCHLGQIANLKRSCNKIHLTAPNIFKLIPRLLCLHENVYSLLLGDCFNFTSCNFRNKSDEKYLFQGKLIILT